MDYFLKANGLVILLLVFYYLFLRNETFFNSIRIYFLVGLVIILAIPLIEIPIYIEKTVSNINYFIVEGATINNTPLEHAFDWMQVLTAIYLAGVVFFSIKFIMQLFSLKKLITKHKITHQQNYKLVETDDNISPFSFFNYIIYNKNEFTKNELNQIITHEKTHVNQWHSIDTLLTYILQITFWFNPFVWLYKKATQQNLEFLADASASNQAMNTKQYQFTLLKASNSHYCEPITNNFYNSLIKKRILMLQKGKSNKSKQLKFVLLMPILAIFLLSFNTKEVYITSDILPEIEYQQVSKSEVIKIIITKNTTDAELLEIKESLSKKGVDFSYTVVLNAKNEITAIDITLNVKKDTTKIKSSANFDNGDKTIKPIYIVYDLESNKIQINGNIQLIDEGIQLSSNSINITNKSDEGILAVVEESNSKSKWKVTSGRNNVAFTNTDTLYVYENKSSKPYADMDNITGNPLYILDGQESSKEAFENLNPQEIASISVWKGKQATEQYGTIGKDGVISIITNGLKNIKKTVQLSSSALYVVDGKESSKEALEKINPDDIESLNVLKDKMAEKKYGDKGENGVIEITLKNETTKSTNEIENIIRESNDNQHNNITFGSGNGKSAASIDEKGEKIIIEGNASIILKNDNMPLFFIGSKEITKSDLNKIAPDNIKSMSVLKGEKAKEKYGDKGKNGVIEITLKKE